MAIATDPNFWDCECPGPLAAFIHPKSQESCKACGARREDQPDSRVNEVAMLQQAKA